MDSLQAFHVAVQGWQNFYLLTGAAAATLIGLMFVAVTFGSTLVRTQSIAVARAFIDPIVAHFVHVFVLAGIMLIPTITPKILGMLLAVLAVFRLGSLGWVYRQLVHAHRIHGDMELRDWLINIICPLISHLSQLAAAVAFNVEWTLALNLLAIANLILAIIGILGAWELLVWIASQVSTAR